MNSRITQMLCEMVRIDSESGDERIFHNYLKTTFTNLGLKCIEDGSLKKTGLGANNLVFILEGDKTQEPLFFSSHSDTVKPGKGIEPVIVDGVVYSKGETILGADDKAGIAIMLEVIQRLKEVATLHPTLEFVITPGEEIGLIGAQALDMSSIRSRFGIVLDSAGPVGAMTLASPTLSTYTLEIEGKAAHAGLEPEQGISALEVLAKIMANLPHGRINSETTSNFGTVEGGVASNVVADAAVLTGEIRSINFDQFEGIRQIYRNTIDTTSKIYGTTVRFEEEIKCYGYRFDQNDADVERVTRAMMKAGITPRYEVRGGGSEANVFNQKGKKAINISIGYEEIHTVNEYIPIAAMEEAVDVCLALIESPSEVKHV